MEGKAGRRPDIRKTEARLLRRKASKSSGLESVRECSRDGRVGGLDGSEHPCDAFVDVDEALATRHVCPHVACPSTGAGRWCSAPVRTCSEKEDGLGRGAFRHFLEVW